MTTPNHLIGGVVFTGFFSSIIGWNIFTNPLLLAVTLFSSMLPDIDTPRSPFGRLFPFSKVINRKFGHRTLTHSFVFLLLSSLVLSLINSAFFDIPYLVGTYSLALFSHIFFDMMTVSGVVCLYPFDDRVFVIPGNARARLRVNDFKSEVGIFFIMVVSLIFLKPLFSNGFWTTYNRMFGTQVHLYSEYVKSDRLLSADYSLKIGSDLVTVSGLVIDCNESESLILIDGEIRKVPQDLEIIKNVIPTKTDSVLSISRLSIRIDSTEFKSIIDNNIFISHEYNNGQFTGTTFSISGVQ